MNLLLTKLRERHTRQFPEHDNEMAGIGVANIMANVLNFPVSSGKQQFLCLGDPVTGQVFIDGAAEIAHKQARQILRGYENLSA